VAATPAGTPDSAAGAGGTGTEIPLRASTESLVKIASISSDATGAETDASEAANGAGAGTAASKSEECETTACVTEASASVTALAASASVGSVPSTAPDSETSRESSASEETTLPSSSATAEPSSASAATAGVSSMSEATNPGPITGARSRASISLNLGRSYGRRARQPDTISRNAGEKSAGNTTPPRRTSRANEGLRVSASNKVTPSAQMSPAADRPSPHSGGS